MKVSLIIPAYNEARYIGRCLASVLENRRACLHEVIVVDNASTDDTALVAGRFGGVRVVHEEQKGLTRARQKGFETASGDIIAYVDADTDIPAGWFEQIEREFTQDERLVCLSGPYRYYDVSKFQSFCVALCWRFVAIPVYLLVGYMTVGGNFAARRNALEKIGGFDASIAFYGEDTDIARRLSSVGKVKFTLSFFMRTSGRRFKGQGFWKTGFIYACNFLSEAFLKRPVTKKYRDLR